MSGTLPTRSGLLRPASSPPVASPCRCSIFADVLDTNNLYANWNTAYGAKTTNTTTVAAGHTYNFAAVGLYDPNAANVFGSYTSTYKSGSATKTLTVYSAGVAPIPTVQPFLTVGINAVTMAINNTAGSAAMAGTVTAGV